MRPTRFADATLPRARRRHLSGLSVQDLGVESRSGYRQKLSIFCDPFGGERPGESACVCTGRATRESCADADQPVRPSGQGLDTESAARQPLSGPVSRAALCANRGARGPRTELTLPLEPSDPALSPEDRASGEAELVQTSAEPPNRRFPPRCSPVFARSARLSSPLPSRPPSATYHRLVAPAPPLANSTRHTLLSSSPTSSRDHD